MIYKLQQLEKHHIYNYKTAEVGGSLSWGFGGADTNFSNGGNMLYTTGWCQMKKFEKRNPCEPMWRPRTLLLV